MIEEFKRKISGERKIEKETFSMVFILVMFNKGYHINHFLFFYDQNCISNHKAIFCVEKKTLMCLEDYTY